jgi:hypothetical protein
VVEWSDSELVWEAAVYRTGEKGLVVLDAGGGDERESKKNEENARYDGNPVPKEYRIDGPGEC